jgi:hypothetical protein
LGQFLQSSAGWWLAALLVLAPWAYGTTIPETKMWLAEALCALGPVFVTSLILRRRSPRIDWLSALLSFGILGYGWWMTWNAKLVYDPRLFYFHPGSPPVAWLPGSVDQKTSAAQMLLITGLFCAFWVVSDLSFHDRWRRRFWLVISLTGVSIVILGLIQRATAAPGIFWRSDLDCGSTFFATYRYHGNAGAFINIILPFLAAECISAFRRRASDLWKAFWVAAFLLILVSAWVNVSRAATLISVCLTAVFCIWRLYEITRGRRYRFSTGQLVVVGIIVVAGGWLLVQGIGFGEAYKQWTSGDSIVNNGRFAVYDTIEHRILPGSGWWGVGPDTFSLIFPFFTNASERPIFGYWAQAHQDYLQTLVEWGFCGAALWFLLFSNSAIRASSAFWRRRKTWDGRTRAFTVACFLALGSVLVHATVDFPMQIASLQLYTSVILGLLASLQYADPHRSSRSTSQKSVESSVSQERRSMYSQRTTWFLALPFGVVLAGCSTNQLAHNNQQKGLPNKSVVDSSAIVVIPNPYVDDLTLANKATEEAKQELIKRGYNVVSSEEEADLVAIPTVETNVVQVVLPSGNRPTELFTDIAGAQLDRIGTVANSLGSLSSLSFRSSAGSIGSGGSCLVIEAFRKDAWDKALIVNELQLAPAWKLRMPLPRELEPALEGAASVRSADNTQFVLPR